MNRSNINCCLEEGREILCDLREDLVSELHEDWFQGKKLYEVELLISSENSDLLCFLFVSVCFENDRKGSCHSTTNLVVPNS